MTTKQIEVDLPNSFTPERSDSSQSEDSLTAPQLYNIYGQGDLDEDEAGDENIYSHLNADLYMSTSHIEEEEHKKALLKSQHKQAFLITKTADFLFKCLIIAVCGNIFMILNQETQKYNPKLPQLSDYKILSFSKDILSDALSQTGIKSSSDTFDLIDFLGNSATGLFLSLSSFISYKFVSLFILKKSIAGTSNNESPLSIFESATLARPWIAIIGISYCLGKIEWNSQLQASFAWSLGNLLIWGFLDSTLSGLIQFSLGSIAAMAIYYFTTASLLAFDVDVLAVELLWFGSIVFSSLLIFGKLNSVLFSH